MTTKKDPPVTRLPRYLKILYGQFFKNFQFAYFWIVGTFLCVAAFGAVHSWSWMLSAVVSLLIGIAGIANVVRPVDQALASIPLSYPDAYGKPIWIIDEVRPLKSEIYRITSGGFTAEDFKPFIGQLAVRIGEPIREIRQPASDRRILELVLKRSDVPRLLPFSELVLSSLSQGEFYVGKGDDGIEKLSLSNMIHLLVAGQTGGGKTQFLRQLIATILAHTRYSHAALIDMKGGIDFQAFHALANFEIATNYNDADQLLEGVIGLFEERKAYLLEKSKTKWSDFSMKELSKDETLKGRPIGPVLLVVDEMAELSKKATQKSANSDLQEKIATIARLARFTGIHLILGTQRPDKNVINMQSKDNIPTRVCFSVPSVAASNIVIGNMMASTIGKNPGRAVFQFDGNKVLQTPLIGSTDLDQLVEKTKERLSHLDYSAKILNRATPQIKFSLPKVDL
jgi:hypothetical protein